MKKLGIILLLLLMVGVAGCGSGEPDTSAEEKTVTVTVPRNVIGDQSDEEIKENAQSEDISVSIGEDDSVTYTMTPEKQQELLLGFKTHFEESLQTALDNGEVPGLVNVSYNDDMSAFDVTINREAFQSQNGEEKLGMLYSAGTAYQLYAGRPEEEIDVTVTLLDQATNDAFGTYSMREVFNAQQSPGDNAD